MAVISTKTDTSHQLDWTSNTSKIIPAKGGKTDLQAAEVAQSGPFTS